MLRRSLLWMGVVLLLLCSTNACALFADLQPAEQPIAQLVTPSASQASGAQISFRLGSQPREHLHTVPGELFTETLDNCTGDTILQQTYEHPGLSEPVLQVDLTILDNWPTYSSLVEALIRDAYDLKLAETANNAVILQASPGVRASFDLREESIVDQNTLLVLSRGETIAELPLQVRCQEHLVLDAVWEETCIPQTPTYPDGSPGKRVTAEPPPGTPGVPLPPEPGSLTAILLARDFLELISAGNDKAAFDLFVRGVESPMAYDKFLQVVEPIEQVNIRTLQAYRAAPGTERVEAVVTVTSADGETAFPPDNQVTIHIDLVQVDGSEIPSISGFEVTPATGTGQ